MRVFGSSGVVWEAGAGIPFVIDTLLDGDVEIL